MMKTLQSCMAVALWLTVSLPALALQVGDKLTNSIPIELRKIGSCAESIDKYRKFSQ